LAITTEAKMTPEERATHAELTARLKDNNAALLDAQHERNRLVQEIEGYIKEGRRLQRHLALLEQGAEKRWETPLWREEATG
jgi:hypothetical protein